jgi:hypothetical protein
MDRMQAIGGAKNPALGFIGDSIEELRPAAIGFGQGKFAVAQRALPIFLDTHTQYSQKRRNAPCCEGFQGS